MMLRRTMLLTLLLLLPANVAWAHAYLEKATPAQRAVLFSAPERVQLWFNERLEAAFCTLTVTGPGDKAVDRKDVHVDPDNPKLLSVGLQALEPGTYTVKFRVLSVDGHVVTNQFTFTVRGSR